MPESFSAAGLSRIRRLAWIVRLLCLLGVVVIGTLPFIFWAEPVGLCALAAAQPLGHTLAILALTWGNPKGERQLWFGLSSDHYLSLLFGLLLLALAQVLHEAARVADENAEFV